VYLRKKRKDVCLINPAQNRNQWRALVNTVMFLRMIFQMDYSFVYVRNIKYKNICSLRFLLNSFTFVQKSVKIEFDIHYICARLY
jgi:hypothetical protein